MEHTVKRTFLTRMSTLRLSVFINEKGGAMLAVLALAVILNITIGAIILSSRYSVKKSAARRGKVSVINIAEAGKEVVLSELRNRIFNPLASTDTLRYSNEPFAEGAYSVRCTTNPQIDTVRIVSTGKIGEDSTRIEVMAYVKPDGMPKWLRGTVTARTDVSTLGNIEIDGRDYDTNSVFGTLLGSGGTVGVASGGTVSAGGSSEIGGNSTAPQSTTIPDETVEEHIDTTGYPQTPEEVLGLPPGALDKYKVTSCPSSSFKGIIYSDQPCDIAEGILIVHNESLTASLDNYHNHFKGIIIADEVKHFNGGSSVLGSVFMLGKTSGGNCFGNGAARIHYSSRIIGKYLKILAENAKRDVTVVSWRELP